MQLRKMLVRILLLGLLFLAFAAALPAETPGWLQGKHMIVGTIRYAPYITFERDSTGKFIDIDGCAHQVMDYLAQKFHFTYEYVLEPNNNFGYQTGPIGNKTWTGIPLMLMKGEIDVAATGLSATYSRSLVMDFTHAFLNDPVKLIIPFPTADSKVGAMTRPFQKEVWVMIGVGVVICTFVLCFLARVRVSRVTPGNKRKDGKDNPELNYDITLLFISGTLINQPRYYRLLGMETAVVAAVWCLTAIVIVNAYTNNITAFLMVPKYTPVISSLEDLVDNPLGYRFAIPRYGIYADSMMNAKEGTRAKIGDSLRRHPEDIYSNSNQSFSFAQEVVVKHKKIEKFGALIGIWNILKKTGTCPVYISSVQMESSRSSLGLPKNSPLTALFNEQIIWMRQTGILDYLEKNYRPPTNRCTAPLVQMERSSSVVRLPLDYLLGVFLLFIIGTGASIVAFVIELIVGRLCPPRFRKA